MAVKPLCNKSGTNIKINTINSIDLIEIVTFAFEKLFNAYPERPRERPCDVLATCIF